MKRRIKVVAIRVVSLMKMHSCDNMGYFCMKQFIWNNLKIIIDIKLQIGYFNVRLVRTDCYAETTP